MIGLEACNPHATEWDGSAVIAGPVSISSILDRLNEHELRRMAIRLSGLSPRAFEDLLKEFSDGRAIVGRPW